MTAFSLADYYYAVHSRLGPERVVPNVDLGLGEHA
jgi:hypothetical protein